MLPTSNGPVSPSPSVMQVARALVGLGAWMLLSSMLIIANKEIYNIFPYPLFVTGFGQVGHEEHMGADHGLPENCMTFASGSTASACMQVTFSESGPVNAWGNPPTAKNVFSVNLKALHVLNAFIHAWVCSFKTSTL